MKNKLRPLFSLLLLFVSTQSYSNTIEKINFIGLNNVTENTLLKIIPFNIGQEYSDSLSDKIIDSLFNTGLFADITITKNILL